MWPPGAKPGIVEPSQPAAAPACAKAVPPADANSIAFADRRRASMFSLSPGTSPTSPIEGWPSAETAS